MVQFSFVHYLLKASDILHIMYFKVTDNIHYNVRELIFVWILYSSGFFIFYKTYLYMSDLEYSFDAENIKYIHDTFPLKRKYI